jgi:hypothetical protein
MTKFTAGQCVVVNKASGLDGEVTGLTANDANLGALSKTPAALAFDGSVAGTATFSSVSVPTFHPEVANSYGRLRFVPSMGAGPKLYAGQSTFVYTFGSMTFTSNSVCKITDTAFTTNAVGVSSCVVASSTVTLKIGTDMSSASFGVEIFGITGSWA